MTAILGISAYYHDSAAALLVDGRVVAAAQEERFTRKKHDPGFPSRAVEYCLKEAGISPAEIKYVAFYDKPLLKFERLVETYLAYAPRGFRSFCQALPVWINEKLFTRRNIRGKLPGYRGPVLFTEHHESHAASAFFPSPFDEAAILTLDGVGEWTTTAFGVGRGARIDLTHELRFPHSLGLLYSAFTYYTGFKINSGEYKLMGLAPYGQPIYADLIRKHLIDIKDDGSFRMDQSYFNYCEGLTMTSRKFDELFGGPARQSESLVTQKEMDLAASIQEVTEEVVLKIGRHVHDVTGQKNLVLAGGVALNCVANGRLLREGPFDRIWVQPAAGDAGGALGAAWMVWHQLLENPRTPARPDAQSASYLGPAITANEAATQLDAAGAVYHTLDEPELLDQVARLLADEKVIGWVQGRMEFGPRALGARSILGDARSPQMQSVMNLKIKFRESFRPFAPCVLREHVDEYFAMRPGEDSPYMLMVAPVREEKRLQHPRTDSGVPEAELEGIEKLKVPRSVIPAVTHVDYSARVQTVDRERHGRFYRLLKRFHAVTECPVLINTSFNVRGEPIVCTAADAYRCFMATGIDALVVENHLLLKSEQPVAQEHGRAGYLAQFALD
ncbi:MAG: carbamoyltransferase [Gemmataceae bacterium]|nr:carbamoyltransferase [Gemmataceae bacterium]